MSHLRGIKALVTSGPTHEPIDPVRFIGNRSSGKQGHAVAEALAREGANVTLVTGPVSLIDPVGVNVVHVTTAEDMLAACKRALPVDVAVFAAAVGDWRVKQLSMQKLKKDGTSPTIQLVENPDILKCIAHMKQERPDLVIGFAAETQHVLASARAKRFRKGCDWIVANDVSEGRGFDMEDNAVTLITEHHEESWDSMKKRDIADMLVGRIAAHFVRHTATA